jgi:polyisoprenoid-binding protein YceI
MCRVQILINMKKLFLFLAICSIAPALMAQQFKSRLAESKMTISGTSTLHDWESAVESFSASAMLSGETIKNASFTAKVKSIKSGTSAMDANTYEAMKEPAHPQIIFKGDEMQLGPDGLRIKGKLTIAGVSRNVEFSAAAEKWTPESLTIQADYAFNMSDYGIEPPRALLGTIRTGDEVKISFKLVLYE